MRGFQKVPYPLGTPEWESFKNFAIKQYKEAIQIAFRASITDDPDIKAEQKWVFFELLKIVSSPLVYLWEQWQLLTPSKRLPYATKEYREVLEKQIEEAKQIAEQVTSQIGTVMAPPQEKKEVSEG